MMIEFEIDTARLIDTDELDTVVLYDEYNEMPDIEYVKASELAVLRDRYDMLCEQARRLCPLTTLMMDLLMASEHNAKTDVYLMEINDIYAEVKERMTGLGVEVI